MSLAEQIIEHGPYPDGEINQLTLNGDEANALREELIDLRRLQAQAEALKRFEVQGWGDRDGGHLQLSHECGNDTWIDEPHTLAELVQRAGEHTEGCR